MIALDDWQDYDGKLNILFRSASDEDSDEEEIAEIARTLGKEKPEEASRK